MPSPDDAELSTTPAPRARHIIDRALEYAALNAAGLSPALIARRKRKSRGYVSIVLRLGHAVRGMESAELAALRSDRVTWKVAQRVVRKDADTATIRHHLRLALGGFSTHNIDRRKHRKGRRTAPTAPREVVADPGTFVWRWDAEEAARDPVAYVASLGEFLRTVHRDATARFRQGADKRAAPLPVPLVGQSLRLLSAAVSRIRHSGAPDFALRKEDREALRALSRLGASLAAGVERDETT